MKKIDVRLDGFTLGLYKSLQVPHLEKELIHL